MDDYKLYEGLSVLFQPEPRLEQENYYKLATNDLIDLGPEESVEDYIENFLESLILNIVSLKDLPGSDYQDDIDDEFFSCDCDSPIEDDNDRTDLHSEFGSERGISTDEGIDATTDEDDEDDDEMNKVKEKIELERDSALVSTKF